VVILESNQNTREETKKPDLEGVVTKLENQVTSLLAGNFRGSGPVDEPIVIGGIRNTLDWLREKYPGSHIERINKLEEGFRRYVTKNHPDIAERLGYRKEDGEGLSFVMPEKYTKLEGMIKDKLREIASKLNPKYKLFVVGVKKDEMGNRLVFGAGRNPKELRRAMKEGVHYFAMYEKTETGFELCNTRVE